MPQSDDFCELGDLLDLRVQNALSVGLHVLDYTEQLQMKLRERQFLVDASKPENYEANKPFLDSLLIKPLEEVIADYDREIEELRRKIQLEQQDFDAQSGDDFPPEPGDRQ